MPDLPGIGRMTNAVERRVRAQHRRYLPDGGTRLLGIVGYPIEHSLSPALHTAVLRILDRNLIYLPFPVSEDRLAVFLEIAPRCGVVGLNVTTPYKEIVAQMVHAADEEAVRCGAVNTIRFGADGALGSTTDGAGILGYLEELGSFVTPVGVLGFGPTARSLVHRLLSGRRGAVVVTRRPENVRDAFRIWGVPEGLGQVLSWEELTDPVASSGEQWDAVAGPVPVWISALPQTAAPPELFWRRIARQAILVDMNYGEGRTPVMDAARASGRRAADGTGPLCQQAARSLSAWLGEEVPVELFHRSMGRPARSLRPKR